MSEQVKPVLSSLLRSSAWATVTGLISVVAGVVALVSASVDFNNLSPAVVSLLVGIGGGLLTALVAFIVRSAVRVEVGGLQAHETSADQSALLLDYVKANSLVALAEELRIDTPEQLEKLESSTSDLSVKAGTPGVELNVGQREQGQVTRTYERSLNALAGRLLAALQSTENAVRQDLALLPPSTDREVLGHLEALEALGVGLGIDAPTPQEIRDRFHLEIAASKRQAYTEVATADPVPLVLVQGRWSLVEKNKDLMILKLAELVTDDGTPPQPMPTGVALHATFEKALRTDMGSGRLVTSDLPIAATILGAPAGMSGNTLQLNPVVIFTRYGSQSQRRYRARFQPGFRGTESEGSVTLRT